MTTNSITVHAPATVANVTCGFDTLGFCLQNPTDRMTIQRNNTGKITITNIEGDYDLPLEAEKNVAGVALLALKAALQDDKVGFSIEMVKTIKPGSGIGSSSASAAGAVVGANYLLGNPFQPLSLIQFAMQGEKLASGSAHADNVAPAIMGGFTLVRSNTPLDVISLPVPKDLHAVIIHPLIEVKTADARRILKPKITLKQGITQWSNVGGLVASLFLSDLELMSRTLEDVVIEPTRAILIPKFYELKDACIKAGAIGGGISGSGPSVFMLCENASKTNTIATVMRSIYEQTNIPFDIHISPINTQGVIIDTKN